ncbi:MAG TPA: hypothetical protein VHV74_11260, partial [Pseudonocardiaceae bacterium]|nr:hypothetical protein [Pseudonocardiaceae bacterium]
MKTAPAPAPINAPPIRNIVGNVFQPVEMCLGGQIEQHVDPPELTHRQLDELRAVRGVAEPTRLQRRRLASRSTHQFDGLLCRVDGHVAADHRRTFPGERQGGGASHAAAGTRD